MTVSLTKGGNVNLSKEAPGLAQVTVGLGWDARGATDGADFDLDASALGVGVNGRVPADDWFIFYNQPTAPGGCIIHSGDNRTGSGAGDDEQIKVDLAAVPATIDRIVFVVTIHEADVRKQNFGQVSHAYIRVVDARGETEIVRYDLGEDYATQTALKFGELYRNGADWKFRALGDGYSAGLRGIALDFGVNV